VGRAVGCRLRLREKRGKAGPPGEEDWA
jgi:hypothetical protein